MYQRNVDYPKAVASDDDEGVRAAIDWCREHMEEGDTLTVWTTTKSNLSNCPELEQLVNQYSDVKHVSGKAGGVPARGPVLMAWADMEDIGKLLRYSNKIRALCVITLVEDRIRPWVTAAQPTVLGDDSAWDELTPQVDPIVVEAMKGLTQTINHNNTITGGSAKDWVVSSLRALHGAGIPLDGAAMQGWALVNGWCGENPQRLAKYANDISAGKRPQARNVLSPDYIDRLRLQVAADESDE